MSLRLGADDYLYKPVSPRLLVERINAQLRHHQMLAAHSKESVDLRPVTCGDLIVDPERHDVQFKGQRVSLTATEFAMLLALVRRPGIVRTRDQLMTASYADNTCVDDRTIDSHIKRIRSKLRTVDPGFTGIETLYGVGYRIIPTKENPANQQKLPSEDGRDFAGAIQFRPKPIQINGPLQIANDFASSKPSLALSVRPSGR